MDDTTSSVSSFDTIWDVNLFNKSDCKLKNIQLVCIGFTLIFLNIDKKCNCINAFHSKSKLVPLYAKNGGISNN